MERRARQQQCSGVRFNLQPQRPKRREAALRRRDLLYRNGSQRLHHLAICSPPRHVGSRVLLVRTIRQCFSRWTLLYVLVELGRASRREQKCRSAFRCLDRKTRLNRPGGETSMPPPPNPTLTSPPSC